MKTIEEVKQFITDFTEKEFKVLHSRNDPAVTQEEHSINVVRLMACYSHFYTFGLHLSKLFDRHIGKETNDHGDRIDSLRQRKVFMIKRYENCAFGEGITPDNDTIFSCFLGNDCKGESDIYVMNLTVAEVKGKLRIVTMRMFTFLLPDEGSLLHRIGWMYIPNSIELHNNLLVKEGELVETVRLIDPDKPEWIADYNR